MDTRGGVILMVIFKVDTVALEPLKHGDQGHIGFDNGFVEPFLFEHVVTLGVTNEG